MEKLSSAVMPRDRLTDILAVLARNNINIIEVHYTGGDDGAYAQSVEFEYQWRTSTTTTKWTRAVLPWVSTSSNSLDDYCKNYELVLKCVKEIRAQNEG